MTQRDLISRLADRGEEMLAKFSETPGASRVLELLNTTRERIDDLQKRVIGLESLERRLDEVEQRLGELEGGAARAEKASAVPKQPASTQPVSKQPTAAKAAADELTAAADKAKQEGVDPTAPNPARAAAAEAASDS